MAKVKIRRRDGTVSELRNSHFIPAFFMIPESIIAKCGAEIRSLPRAYYDLMGSWDALSIVESDLFRLCIMDAYAYMVWPYLCPEIPYMEILSGYDPVWRLAHCAPIWIKELEYSGIIPNVHQMHEYRLLYTEPFNTPEHHVEVFMSYIVPKAVERHDLGPIIEAVKDMRCFEDFDYRESNQKTDFYRKWYHTRSLKAEMSFDMMQEHFRERYDDVEWELPDPLSTFEDEVTEKVDVQNFLATLEETDRQILQMREDGYTQKEIAARLEFKTHSAVSKRIRKIGKEYQKFSGLNFGF